MPTLTRRKRHHAWDIPKQDKAELKRMRLPGWAFLPLFVIAFCAAGLFDHLGRPELMMPVLATVLAFVLILVVKRRLRHYVWFWATITVLAALHVVMLWLIPWTKKWVPAATATGIGIIDIFAMLGIISIVGNLLGSEV